MPIGVPKVMVSTMTSDNVAEYVGGSDTTMVYFVTDVAGLNRISRRVLGKPNHFNFQGVAHPGFFQVLRKTPSISTAAPTSRTRM